MRASGMLASGPAIDSKTLITFNDAVLWVGGRFIHVHFGMFVMMKALSTGTSFVRRGKSRRAHGLVVSTIHTQVGNSSLVEHYTRVD